MNVLLLVDPQIDFVTGSLAVPGAVEAMDYLTQWIEEHGRDYESIVVTMDQHPADHCSFDICGGPWPVHCVRFTQGAALYPPIAEAVMELKRQGKHVVFIPKAMTRHKEAFSAFQDAVPETLMHALRIDVAGLAGDYCVANTISDLRRLLYTAEIRPLDPCIAWIGKPYPLQ